ELRAREVERQPGDDAFHAVRGPVPAGGERLDAAAVDRDKGELGRDEERGDEEQEHDGGEPEGSTDQPNLGRANADRCALASLRGAPMHNSEGMGLGGLAAAAAVMALGACVQGAVGFGAALVSAPLLVLIDTDFV